MSLDLTADEIAVLTQGYRLTIEQNSDLIYSIPAKNLLDTDFCLTYLQEIASFFNSSSILVTASLFAKRYSVLTMASALYAMSRFEKGLNVDIENAWIESNNKEKPWLPSIRLIDWSTSLPKQNRLAWRDQIMQHIFANNLERVWRILATTAKIPKATLWENTAIYVNWLYETKIREEANPLEIARLEDDYYYIAFQASGDLFGERKNPLTKYCDPKVFVKDTDMPIRLRKTCCFYYLSSDEANDYCITCPKIKRI